MKKLFRVLAVLVTIIMSISYVFGSTEDTAKSIENFESDIKIKSTNISAVLGEVFEYDPRLAIYYKGYKGQTFLNSAKLQLQYINTDIPINKVYVARSSNEVGKLIRQAMLYSESQIAFVTVGIPSNIDIEGIVNYIVQKDPISSMGYRGYSISSLNTQINNYVSYIMKINYDIDAQRLNEMKRATEEEACQIVASNIAMDMPPYMKIYTIHNYIVNNCNYARDYDTNKNPAYYTAYGTLVDGVGVCDGYANATQLLSNLCGIESMKISGTSKGSNHSWNLIKLDNDYYHLDTTWDDPLSSDGLNYITHDYYNLSDNEISADHSWDRGAYPPANGEVYNNSKTCQLIMYDTNKYTKGYKSFNSVFGEYPPLGESTRYGNSASEATTVSPIEPTAVLDNLGDQSSVFGNDILSYIEITVKEKPYVIIGFVIIFVSILIFIESVTMKYTKYPKNIRRIMKTINKISFVRECHITGSYKNGNADKYSDVDITVTLKNVAPDYALLKITEKILSEYDVLWYDFAKSLMPDKFLVSVFIKGNNPFRYIDIGIYNTDYELDYDKSDFENQWWSHIAKLWIMNLKHYIRQPYSIEDSFEKMLNQAGIMECEDYCDGFEQVLDVLIDDADADEYYVDLMIKEYERYFR